MAVGSFGEHAGSQEDFSYLISIFYIPCKVEHESWLQGFRGTYTAHHAVYSGRPLKIDS